MQRAYRFFHPPRCPGAPPLERGAGPNSGPDWRESVGWKILLPLLAPVSSREGFREGARSGRKGRDSGPCISSRWGLWTFDRPRLVDPAPCPRERASLASDPARGEGTEAPPLSPSLREELGEDEEAPPRAAPPRFFSEPVGRFAASPYFFIPA